jgi:hypothetical protein
VQTLPNEGSAGSRLSEPLADEVDKPLPRSIATVLRSERLITLLVVVLTTAFVIAELRPSEVFGPNLDVGGDNAAHVVAVYYFIHDLLPHGQLSGWDPQWFDGFPLYVFYFPFPAILVALANVVFSYAVAFKLITLSGIVIMPVAAYLFGRLSGFARPVPALMCLATLPYIFSPYYPYQIDGGNLLSTLAGEFSFTLSLSLSLIFLGVFSYALRTGKLRWLAALLFCITLLCHVVPALFAAVAALAIAIAHGRLASVQRLIAIGGVGALLAAFWLLRFGADLRYSTCMCYTRVPVGISTFPQTPELAMQILALVGALIAVFRRDALALALSAMAILAFFAFAALPSGVIYNGRWLPFWFLMTDLLAAYAFAHIGAFVFMRFHLRAVQVRATAVTGLVIAIGALAFFLGNFPFVTTPANWRSVAPGWLSWNNTGYQAKPDFPQLEALVSLLDNAAKSHGCGRLDYEYSPNTTDAFGSTLFLMSLPYFTKGCFDTTEGVYYESSTTTPFHFLDQAELSIDPSNPMVGIPYQSLNVADGIKHLQLQGVQYFLANSDTVETEASADPQLYEVASMPEDPTIVDGTTASSPNPHWVLYAIRDSALVTPLSYAPVVEANMSKSLWLSTAIAWYQTEPTWSVPIATGGPASWKRIPAGQLVAQPTTKRLPAVSISHIKTTNESITFHVSRTGVPVLVKIPYFPNWQATGAIGPYEVTPNLMVVIPSSKSVALHYGTTGVDWVGRAGSLVGVVGLGAIARTGTPIPGRPAREPLPERTPTEPLVDDSPEGDIEDTADPDAPVATEVQDDGL